jgi:hypothetical protein
MFLHVVLLQLGYLASICAIVRFSSRIDCFGGSLESALTSAVSNSVSKSAFFSPTKQRYLCTVNSSSDYTL